MSLMLVQMVLLCVIGRVVHEKEAELETLRKMVENGLRLVKRKAMSSCLAYFVESSARASLFRSRSDKMVSESEARQQLLWRR